MNARPQPGSKPKHAWITLDRVDPVKRPAANRVSDFHRVEIPYDESTATEQANRCIQCPAPVCVEVCPLGTPLNELLRLTADRQFKEAAELLFASLCIPEIASHTCLGGRQCEAACVLAGRSDPVPIRSITRFLLDYGWHHGLAEPAIDPQKNQRVAVTGSGICGLAAADALSRRGYSVTVFDSRQNPGGRMMNGLPGFRVDTELVIRRVELLKQRGIRFHMGVSFGDDTKLADLRREFDAVFLGFGRAEGMPLDIPGANLKGVHQAFPFVSDCIGAEPESPRVAPPLIDVRGRKVVVLGGGDTAMDALRIAIRHGAGAAVCLYRRDEMQMPADTEEYSNALEEGARFHFLTQPVAVLGNAAGEVTGLRCVRMELIEPDDTGRRNVRAVPGSEFDLDADVLFVAYGFTALRLPSAEEFASLAVDDRGRVVVDAERMTNLAGVFAGGSIVRGPAPLSDVVRDSREAAAAIDRYLAARRS